MLSELLAQPGVTEESRLAGPIGIMAFHGGSLERMTDVIAAAVADLVDVSTYVVRQPETLRWHVPSREFDPAHSPTLAAFLDHVDTAVAVHGYGRDGMFTTLLAGGSNRDLAVHVASAVGDALPEYEVRHDLSTIPEELRGLHPDNPVNRLRHGGVQLELPPRVRGLGPYWEGHDASGLRPHTGALVAGLARALSTW